MAVKEKVKKEEGKMEMFKDYISSNFGKKEGLYIKDPENIIIEKFPTGSISFDSDMKKGWSKGTLIEVYGPSGSGKTTLCIHAVSEHQKKYPNEPILWIDLEKVFDPVYFQKIGIDISPENFILVRPSTGEDAWELMINFTKNFGNGVVVLDSVTLLLPQKEEEGQVGDAQMASAARMNSQGLRKLFPNMKLGGTTVFAINQVRKNIGGYGDPNVTTGGGAWEFYARTRIKTAKTKGLEGEYSNNRFKQIKSNYGNQDVETETTIEYGVGIDRTKEIFKLCVDHEIIQKSGSWFNYGDVKLGQGADNIVQVLNDNVELQEELMNRLKDNNIL